VYLHKFLTALDKLFLPKASAVIVVNDSIADWYENEYGFRPYVLKAYPDARWQSVDSDKTKFRSKFGIPVEQYREILDLVQQYKLHVRTLHLHSGSDIKEPEVFVKGIEILFDLIPHFPELEVLDLGGGFKVPYSSEEKETPLPELAHQLKNAFDLHPLANGKSLQIWFEPGKFLVSECGYLLVSVNVLKDNNKEVFAGVNSGLNHLIRPTLYDAYHRIENLSNPDGIMKPYTVTGYICETDTFANNRRIAEINEGDILCFKNAGAYCFSMSSNYNSRYKPAEVLWMNGEGHLIRAKESFEDLLRNQIPLPVAATV
jgi:diaminopimelate decarboxylase